MYFMYRTQARRSFSMENNSVDIAMARHTSIVQDQQQDDNKNGNREQNERETEAYDVDEISSTKRELVEYMARNPGESYAEIANAVGCSNSYPSRIRASHLDTLLERGLELNQELGDFQIVDRRRKKDTVKYSDLTEIQKFIISQYNEIKREINKPKEEIIQDIKNNNTKKLTIDGTSASTEYLTAVVDNFSNLYNDMQESEQDTSVRSTTKGSDKRKTTVQSVSKNNADEIEEVRDKLQTLLQTFSSSRKMAKIEIEEGENEDGEARSAIARFAVLKTVENELEEILESLN